MLSATLQCNACDWQTTCGEEEIARRLRVLGLLRRTAHPPEDLVRELLATSAERLACDQCGKAGLAFSESKLEDDDGDWQQATVCEVCRKPIPPRTYRDIS